jgi:glucokinase
MNRQTLLVGDIGGTNARFALAAADQPGFRDEQTLKCADFASAEDAIKHYLDSVAAATPAAICLAAAGPIVKESVRFTNNPWTISAADLRADFSIEAVRLLNDFEAIAWSIPMLDRDHLMPIGLPEARSLADRNFTVGVIGPGTGLGCVGLKKMGDQLIPIAGEAAHGGFAPETQVQLDILQQLRERYDRVSSERVVSGGGIENVYRALCRIHGEKRAALSAAEIFAASGENGDPRANEAVEVFFEVLGQVAGDFSLALGAFDGMFIAGGIAKRYPERLANSRFREGFERKGRYRSLLEQVPTQLITHPEPGLLGAAHCAVQLQTNA